MCTIVLKEDIAYYVINSSSVFCTLLDATKAFDRVEYVKMFKLLIDRKLPPVCIRLLVNMYTSQVTRVEWNGVCSDYFSIRNGVKQEGVISPVLFCVYVDGHLKLLADAKVGCYIGHVFVGALAYNADDIALLAHTARDMHKLFPLCDEFASRFNVLFNSKKSKCLWKIISLIVFLSRCLISVATLLNFFGSGHISVI